jgi:hypothetical protein
MIYFDENFAPDVPLNHARIGINNLVTTAEADSALAGFPASAVTNPLTYEFWRPVGGSGVLTAEFDAGPVDYVGIAAHNLQGGTVKVEVKVGGSWVVIDEVEPESNAPLMFLFDKVEAEGVQITVDGEDASIGVVYAGQAIAMQRRVWGGINPINFSRKTTIRPNVSENGQWLGRSIIREGSATTVSWRNLEYNWYREYFDPFVEQARITPYFFAMRPDKYPEISGYVWTNGDITPTISGVQNYLDVSVEMEGLSIE